MKLKMMMVLKRIQLFLHFEIRVYIIYNKREMNYIRQRCCQDAAVAFNTPWHAASHHHFHDHPTIRTLSICRNLHSSRQYLHTPHALHLPTAHKLPQHHHGMHACPQKSFSHRRRHDTLRPLELIGDRHNCRRRHAARPRSARTFKQIVVAPSLRPKHAYRHSPFGA